MIKFCESIMPFVNEMLQLRGLSLSAPEFKDGLAAFRAPQYKMVPIVRFPI
jgi:hypothetical protein